MERLFVEIGLAVVLFAGTNIDDVFVLLAFFSDRRFKANHVIIGQYLGILSLTLGSMLLSLFLRAIPDGYVGLLGLIPLGIGVKRLFAKDAGGDQDDAPERSGMGAVANMVSVAGVTIANGGDTISVFTSRSLRQNPRAFGFSISRSSFC